MTRVAGGILVLVTDDVHPSAKNTMSFNNTIEQARTLNRNHDSRYFVTGSS